jgi:ATP-dependent DNA helicase RecG
VRRHELPKLPEVVIREAIANAVAHRSYEELGRAARIELRPDRVVVESPGGLPEPVTEANIRETQSARNINVIRVLRRLGLAEDTGRGVDVIQDSMAAALLDPPQFQDLEHSVRVTLPIRGAITPQERAWVEEVESQGLIAPGDRLLLVHAARGESLTNEQVRELLGVDSRDARKALRRLRDAGFIEQVGERGGAYYLLSPAVGAPAAFRLGPAALRELVVSLAAGGAPLTNALVRSATGLDRAEALRLLEGLVRDGRLVRKGEKRGTHYVLP